MKPRFFLVIMFVLLSITFTTACAEEEASENATQEQADINPEAGEPMLVEGDLYPAITNLVEAEYISGILHPAVNGTGTADQISFVLKFALKDEWYMYWRTPGDGGLAPTFDWSASDNLQSVDIGWPAPKRFEQDGLYSFGYTGIVEMPVTVTVKKVGLPLKFMLDTSLIVCNKICVPQKLSIVADISPAPTTPSSYAEYFKEVKEKLPSKDGTNGLKLDTAVLGKNSIVVTLYSKDGFDGTDVFVESGVVMFTAPPEMEQDAANPTTALFRINAPEGTDPLTDVLMGNKVTVTAVRNGIATEKEFSF